MRPDTGTYVYAAPSTLPLSFLDADGAGSAIHSSFLDAKEQEVDASAVSPSGIPSGIGCGGWSSRLVENSFESLMLGLGSLTPSHEGTIRAMI